ncbi:kinase-like protein [Gyrodon lividus]|nr:kinase-like protein [Gyrodon lividus]
MVLAACSQGSATTSLQLPVQVINGDNAVKMSGQEGAPPAAVGGRSFITIVRQLIRSPPSGPLGYKEEEEIRAMIISAAASTEANDTVILPFSQSPHEVTKYIRGRRICPDDTSGGFSDIFKCELEIPGESRTLVAVKALRVAGSNVKALQDRGNKLRGEVHIWIRLDHPNVLKLHGIANGFARLPALVSPWVEKGTLTKYLEGPGRGISKGKRISLLIKVAEALDYIHSHHVVHGDLTGSNILINDDGQPLISDFGLSAILEEYNETSYFKSRRPGSIRWAAPELLAELQEPPKPGIESDVYSYGCVMLHTLSGKIPYNEIRDIHVPYAKIQGQHPQRPTNLPIERTHWELIENCLDAIPGDRPQLTDIIGFLSR